MLGQFRQHCGLRITGEMRPRFEDQFNSADYDYTCYIVGGGPSLKNFDWADLEGKFVIAINRAYEVLPNAQIVYFTDKQFWRDHQKGLLAHKGKKAKGAIGNTWIGHPEVHEYWLSGPQGLDTTKDQIRHGYNSAYAALNMAAAHLGFKKIYLLGLDMKWGNSNNPTTSHWHSGYVKRDAESVYTKMMKAYDTIILPLQQLNVQVYNVTLDSKLKAFPKVSFVEVFGEKYANRVMKTVDDPKLLGDHVEAVLEKVGAKKAAQVFQRITGKPCNCGQRKAVLNSLHQRLQERRGK